MIKQYVVKPNPFEAIQWDGTNLEEIKSKYKADWVMKGFYGPSGEIKNILLLGEMQINEGDYIFVENAEIKSLAKETFEMKYMEFNSSDISLRHIDN